MGSYGAGLPNVVSEVGDWNRTLARAHNIEKDFTTQLNLNGKSVTGKVTHQALVGTDFTRVLTQTDAFKVISYDKINILDPSLYTPRNDIPDATLTTTTTAPSNRVGIYTQDFITLTKKLKLPAGIRWSYQKTVQPRAFTAATRVTSRIL